MPEPIKINIRQRELLSKLEVRITSKIEIGRLMEFSIIILELAQCYGAKLIPDDSLVKMEPNTVAYVLLFESTAKAMGFYRMIKEYG